MNGITEQDTIKRDDAADPRTWGRTDATMSYKPYIYDVSLPELTRWVETNNYEPYRGYGKVSRTVLSSQTCQRT